MKRFYRMMLLAMAVTLCAAAVACGAPKTAEEVKPTFVPHKPLYTPEEEQVGAFQASDARFKLSRIEQQPDSPLAGKVIYWLGSSVTDGQNADHVAVAEYLAARTGAVCKKDAVSGTTLLDDGSNEHNSYTARLMSSTTLDPSEKIDAFICQISTNDCKSVNVGQWGEMTAPEVTDRNAFDLSTSIGGVEFIIAYVTETWHCPVYFYSGAYFGDEGVRSNADPSGTDYGRFIEEIRKVAAKWNTIDGYCVEIIDLYNDASFNARVSDAYYKWATADAIHPKLAGFLQWWEPYFEAFLSDRLK